MRGLRTGLLRTYSRFRGCQYMGYATLRQLARIMNRQAFERLAAAALIVLPSVARAQNEQFVPANFYWVGHAASQWRTGPTPSADLCPNSPAEHESGPSCPERARTLGRGRQSG